jgi:hypothetical protein
VDRPSARSASDARGARSSRSSRAYWICQAGGWSLYVALTAYQMSRSLPPHRAVVEPLLAALIGVSLTHALRRLARGRRWALLDAGALAPRVVLASVGLAVTHVVLLSAVEVGAYGDRPPSLLLLVVFASIRWSMVFFIWLALYFGYALMVQRREGELRRLHVEKALQAAELSALRSQLNPHFLFNSLNSIRALVASDQGAAQNAITSIANMLRYTLAAGREQTVSFERELAMVEDYLALEGLRLDERLVVERRIDDDVRRDAIPIMLLQILVENAIKHGIAHLPKGGVLQISARRVGGALAIEVQNPRPRTPVASASKDEESPGIGLANVAERLALLFGPGASLALDLSVSEQATSRVVIPLAPLAAARGPHDAAPTGRPA